MRPSAMRGSASRVPIIVFALLLVQAVKGSSAVTLEHSIDGIHYSKAVSFDLGDQSVVDIPGYSVSNILSTSGDVTNAMLYFVRVVVDGVSQEQYPVASIPLACWLHAGSNARVELFASAAVQSISLRAPCPVSHGDTVRGEGEEFSLRCTVRKPRMAAQVPLMQGVEYLDLTPNHQASEEESQSQGGRTTAKKTQAKDDRTWLQKNWMFVAVGVFILLNKLGSAAQDQQGRSSARNVRVRGNPRP